MPGIARQLADKLLAAAATLRDHARSAMFRTTRPDRLAGWPIPFCYGAVKPSFRENLMAPPVEA